MKSKSLSNEAAGIIRQRTLQAATKDYFHNMETDASSLSIVMNCDRSNLSRILNKLHREGILIKIQGRPTLYLDKKTLSEFYQNQNIPDTFENIDHLIGVMKFKGKSSVPKSLNIFKGVIGNGSNESLNSQIDHIIELGNYPNNVHGYLIYGEHGTGKHYMSQLIIQLEKEIGRLDTNVIYNIDLKENSNLYKLGDELKTYSQNQNGGIIFYNIDEECKIDVMLDFLNNIRIIQPKSKLFYILLCNSKETSEYIYKNMSCFVEYVKMPKLNERSIKERILFTLKFFQKQSDIINKPIRIDKNCIYSFIAAQYMDNLYSLDVEIYHTCKNAYANNEDNQNIISISPFNIPMRIYNSISDSDDIMSIVDNIHFNVSLSNIVFYPKKSNSTYLKLFSLPISNKGFILDSIKGDLKNNFEIQTLGERCELDLSRARLKYSKNPPSETIYILSKLVYPIIHEEFNPSPNPIDFYGLYEHLYKVIRSLITNNYKNILSNVSFEAVNDSFLLNVSNKIIGLIEEKFSIILPMEEREYVKSYIHLVNSNTLTSKINIIVLSSWEETANIYEKFTNSVPYNNKPKYLIINPKLIGMDRENQFVDICDKILSVYQGSGLLIISEEPLDSDLYKFICEKIKNNILFVTRLSRSILSKAMMIFDNNSNTLDTFQQYLINDNNFIVENYFSIKIKDIIRDSLPFFDIDKVYCLLSNVLSNIISELNINYKDNLAVRFITHSAFVLERIIKGQCLPYKNVEKFILVNQQLFDLVRNSMIIIEDNFKVKIPDAEIAYIVEIFLEFSKMN
jgi:transcriptional regulator with AAA-type ATPase domain/acyl carrier protein